MPAPDRTGELLATMDTVAAFIRAHDLQAATVEVWPHGDGHRFCPDTHAWTLPVLPKARVVVSTPLAFLAWARTLKVRQIVVHRRDFDTTLGTSQDLDGLTWSVLSWISRPSSGPHLPGITVDWQRTRSGRRGDQAVITVADLAATVDAMGIAEVAHA